MIPLKLQRLLLFLFSCQVKSDSATPSTEAHHGLLSSAVSWSLLKFMSIESVVLYNYLILCFPLLLLPSLFPSVRVFSNKSALHITWPKYWSFSFSNRPSNEYSGLIPFRTDCFNLLPDYVQSRFSHVQLCVKLWTLASQVPLSMGFSRQEYWSGLLFLPPGDLPSPGIKPECLPSLHWQAGSFPLVPPGEPPFKCIRLTNIFSRTTVWKHQFFMVQLSHAYSEISKISKAYIFC